ncbi:hypothetical protein NH340_JMT09204 [Sarcoptes scabiei]|nr:hypothetical protein NH340_JMT09204 [Sarcoptes scabiei]
MLDSFSYRWLLVALFGVFLELASISALDSMLLNINLIAPIERNHSRIDPNGRIYKDRVVVNVTVPIDLKRLKQIQNIERTSQYRIEQNNRTRTKHSISNDSNLFRSHSPMITMPAASSSAPSSTMPILATTQTFLEPNHRFLNEIKNGKKTDVSVTIYHHQAIQDPIYDNGDRKMINSYGNGYGLHYGFDLDGKYAKEKGLPIHFNFQS